jgi:predicted dehydrogenase
MRDINIALIGEGFMGRTHSNAWSQVTRFFKPAARPVMHTSCGRREGQGRTFADTWGWKNATGNWHSVVSSPEIELVDIVTPNKMHAPMATAAIEAGKHVACEKPLGRDADESYDIWQRVAAAGVKHLCAFNYRFVPAVRLAREMIAAGELGEIRHFRARYLQAWGADAALMTWRFDREQAGSGALGDLGAHIIDLAHHLVGEIATVSGLTRTFVAERAGHRVDVDDAFEAAVEFSGGAFGTLEASRVCQGRINHLALEVNGSKGSIVFDLERLNELRVYLSGSSPGERAQGFRTTLVTEPDHPFMEYWWPPGHILGWEHTFVHELHHLLTAIREGGDVRPYGADFEDGYRAAEVCDAIVRSAATGAREPVTYRG